MSDSFDADLQGRDLDTEGRQKVLMERNGRGPGGDEALARLAGQLSGAVFTTIDESTGIFEIALEEPDHESAVRRVINAVAAAGADDHVNIAEHADTKEHWKKDWNSEP
ncbi:MAG TPA: hypothetical protein VF533_04440 [Solirubrobacteraceae bacterium]|jgi:hypothetical protein